MSGPHVHLVGVGGAGMSGIARILLQRGGSVSGSDLSDGRVLQELRMLGGRIQVGHDAANIEGADVVVTSTAVPANNPELEAARDRGLLVLRRAEMLARIMDGQQAVLVAGTHGKTTTTSMTVVALQAAGHDPSFAIGGALNESGTNAHAGRDLLFVAEADESDRSFLAYRPDLAIVTNIEHDHPDEFEDLADVVRAFRDFAARRPDGASALLCADDDATRALADDLDDPVVLYGTDPRATFRTVVGEDGEHRFRRGGEELARFTLSVPGFHNVQNATAALATCALLDVDPAEAAPGLARFTGASRRFQILGKAAGVTVVDDYAHHPTELRATLAAARTQEARRVIVVVQPHRFSRTQLLGQELGRAAAASDIVVVTEVYGAGEAPVPGVSGRLVADAAASAGANVRYQPHLPDVIDDLAALVEEGDLVLTTGAGDVTQVGPALLSRLGGVG
jgi:UDP-N-acetylmuramate--alanine ligase